MSIARNWLVPFLVCLAAGTALALHWLPLQAPVGDEPHYLLMADSLLHDADLDLANQYRTLAPELDLHAQDYWNDGRLYPMHQPGVPALVAPGYALGGRGGAAAVILLVWSGMGALLLNWLRRTLSPRAAWLAWAGVMFTMPVMLFAVQIYSDMIGAALILLVLYLMDRIHDNQSAGLRTGGLSSLSDRVTKWRWLVTGLALGALPWMEEKFALPGLFLTGLALWTGRPRGRNLLAFLLPPLLMGVAFAAMQLSMYGMLIEPWRAQPPGLWRWDLAPRQAAALWLDQEFGLLPYTPFYALALPGLALMLWRREIRAQAAWVFVAFALVFIPAAAWFDWHGGYSVPARELVGAAPLLSLPVGALLDAPRGLARGALWVGYGLLVGWGVFVMLFGLQYPSFRLYNTADGYGNLWQALSPYVGRDMAALLPSFLRGG